MLVENGTHILKFYLHIDADEQLERFKQRILDPKRHWKISDGDYAERPFWDAYTEAFEAALEKCSTKHAPWFIIPSNHKWFRNLAISKIVVEVLEDLKCVFPFSPISGLRPRAGLSSREAIGPLPASPLGAQARSKPRTSLIFCLIGLLWSALPGPAQAANEVDELRRLVVEQQQQIELQQQQLKLQQQQLDAQRMLLEDMQQDLNSLAATSLRTPPPAEAAVQTAEPHSRPLDAPPAEATSRQASPERRVAIFHDDKHDRVHQPAQNVQRGDHSKGVKLPGTDTEISFGGFVELQIQHDTTAIDNTEFVTSQIPVNGGSSQTQFVPQFTRLEVGSKTPVGEYRVNTYVEVDFDGDGSASSAELRLRQAYGEFGSQDQGFSVLAGQTFATMVDLKALPETLDYLGPSGGFDRRQPMVRSTKSLGDQLAAEFSLETPENVSYVDATKRTRWPDVVAAGTWNRGGKYLDHLRLAVLGRDLRADGDTGSTESAFGWALNGSGKLLLPFIGEKDNFRFALNYGAGYGAQLADGPADAVFDSTNSELKTIGVASAQVGLQHWWSDTWRSNLTFGHLRADNPNVVEGDQLKQTSYAGINVIWTPYDNLRLGLEYLWGRLENEDGDSGTANRFLASSKFSY